MPKLRSTNGIQCVTKHGHAEIGKRVRVSVRQRQVEEHIRNSGWIVQSRWNRRFGPSTHKAADTDLVLQRVVAESHSDCGFLANRSSQAEVTIGPESTIPISYVVFERICERDLGLHRA